jgi:hypothetical protein
MEINNRNNGLNPLINNQNKTIINIKIKQVYAKLEKDLMSIFDGLRNNSKNVQLNNSKNDQLNNSKNWQLNDINYKIKYK